ncbi:uncharacterized protein B0H18DRAFT_1122792 [Fomitopsis serialis]|uniref:uncharacterized protein n=1 Tax=Fomitopsis serialis TaxID=139415 RepID=UPI0020075A67|nr:uncharacterized protein B0H18DRAFT_1122792 [Neoantrodia serialis]KAH9918986.1 hypothetical protein B0H18DRAFT_1122792 [Neoantrodia serialis]
MVGVEDERTAGVDNERTAGTGERLAGVFGGKVEGQNQARRANALRVGTADEQAAGEQGRTSDERACGNTRQPQVCWATVQHAKMTSEHAANGRASHWTAGTRMGLRAGQRATGQLGRRAGVQAGGRTYER